MSDFTLFTQEDVRRAFWDHPWQQLRFSQLFPITQGKMAGVSLTPFNAGRMIGGAVWKVSLRDGSELLCARDFCHKKERHLNGAVLSEVVTSRPALVVAGASGCMAPSVNMLKRDTELLGEWEGSWTGGDGNAGLCRYCFSAPRCPPSPPADADVIVSTLRGDGSVLVPVDAAGRVLELLLLLEEFWAKEKMAYPLVILSHTCASLLERAQQQIEWMSDHVCAAFGSRCV